MVGRETASERLPASLRVDGVEQHDRRNQQLAAGDAHQRGDNPDA
jgi:hypothetical protein